MNKFFALLITGTLAILGLAAAAQALRPEPFDPVQYERDRLAIEQMHAVAPFATFAAQAWAVLPLVVAIVLLALLAAWGSVALIRFRRLAQPDDRGLLPVNLWQLADVAPQALGAYHGAKQLAAAQQPVPHTITYSPSEQYAPHNAAHYAPNHATTFAPRLDYRSERPGLPELPANEPAVASLPDIIDLVQIGFRPTKEAILLGLGAGSEQITVPMRQLWHIGTAGPTGAGKSNIARLIIPQLQSLGAQVAIIDPKWTPYDAESGEDWRAIGDRLFLPAARKPDQIRETIAYFHDELERRLELRTAGQPVGSPLFLYADEYTTITEDVKDAGERIARLARLGRGVRIFLLIAAHDLLVKSGAGDTRDQIRTGFYLGGDAKTGSVLLDLPQREVLEAEAELKTGIAMLRSAATSPAKLIRIPYASNDGIAALLGVPSPVPSPAPSEPRAFDFRPPRHEGGNEGGNEGAATIPLQARSNAENLTAEEARIVAAFLSGKSPGELATELNGGKSSGAGYAQAARKVAEILRRAMAR